MPHGGSKTALLLAAAANMATLAAKRIWRGAADAGSRTVMANTASSTIDPREAAHFGGMAADWWDPKGSSAMLHKLNPVRLRYIRDAIDRSEERRVGKECVSTCRSRWSPYH